MIGKAGTKIVCGVGAKTNDTGIGREWDKVTGVGMGTGYAEWGGYTG